MCTGPGCPPWPTGCRAGAPHAGPGRQSRADAGIHAQTAGHGAEHQWGAPRLRTAPLWAARAPAAPPPAAATAAAPPRQEPSSPLAGCGHGLHDRGRAPAGRGHGLGHGQGRAWQVDLPGTGCLSHAGVSKHLCCHVWWPNTATWFTCRGQGALGPFVQPPQRVPMPGEPGPACSLLCTASICAACTLCW